MPHPARQMADLDEGAGRHQRKSEQAASLFHRHGSIRLGQAPKATPASRSAARTPRP